MFQACRGTRTNRETTVRQNPTPRDRVKDQPNAKGRIVVADPNRRMQVNLRRGELCLKSRQKPQKSDWHSNLKLRSSSRTEEQTQSKSWPTTKQTKKALFF